MNNQHKVLVLGATGKTGRRIVQRLAARSVPIRIGSRSAELPFDWENDATWAPALQGIHAVYIAYQPDLAIPGTVDRIQRFVNTAVEVGVQRLVLLSGRGEEEAERCEQVVQQSGVEWTIVRCSFFAQNFSEGIFLDSVLSGEVVLPVGDVREPFVDVDDIADVATAALIEDGHAGQLYELTGPRLLTFAEAVAEIAQATGRTIRFVSVPVESYTRGLRDMGLPEDVIWLIDYLFSTVMDGRNEYLTDGVQRALGREPRDFATYAQQVAHTGLWNTELVSE
ncbi:MAG: NAD(P)H-binding protein [Chloroflexi bacterium]|nr:NAD(P)H-binding protein [Chloroflexota bacterium]